MKLMLMAASLRKGSVNKKLIQVVQDELGKLNIAADLKAFNDYPLPIYDGDVEAAGFPAPTLEFIKDMEACDGVVFSVPEYNYAMPGSFKNLFDWVSRVQPMPWTGKKILLMSASPALPGGIRGLWQMRVPFEGCGAFVYPDMFALGSAYSAFTLEGRLIDQATETRLKEMLLKFSDFVKRL